MLISRAPAPLLVPPNALPDEEGRLVEGLDRVFEAPGEEPERLAPVEAVGRLAEGVPVEGRAPAVPVEGRAPTLPVEGPAPPEPQPRACELRAEFAAAGEPLLLRRLWSGCHFCPPAVVLARGAATLPSRLMLAVRL